MSKKQIIPLRREAWEHHPYRIAAPRIRTTCQKASQSCRSNRRKCGYYPPSLVTIGVVPASKAETPQSAQYPPSHHTPLPSSRQTQRKDGNPAKPQHNYSWQSIHYSDGGS